MELLYSNKSKVNCNLIQKSNYTNWVKNTNGKGEFISFENDMKTEQEDDEDEDELEEDRVKRRMEEWEKKTRRKNSKRMGKKTKRMGRRTKRMGKRNIGKRIRKRI